jgi:hypothetical protein
MSFDSFPVFLCLYQQAARLFKHSKLALAMVQVRSFRYFWLSK